MALKLRTNRQWRQFVYRSEVPQAILKSQFDWQDENDGNDYQDGFFCYRGHWYHTADFMRTDGNGDLAGWDGYAGDSYFSGVLIKLSSDGERYQIATYIS